MRDRGRQTETGGVSVRAKEGGKRERESKMNVTIVTTALVKISLVF